VQGDGAAGAREAGAIKASAECGMWSAECDRKKRGDIADLFRERVKYLG